KALLDGTTRVVKMMTDVGAGNGMHIGEVAKVAAWPQRLREYRRFRRQGFVQGGDCREFFEVNLQEVDRCGRLPFAMRHHRHHWLPGLGNALKRQERFVLIGWAKKTLTVGQIRSGEDGEDPRGSGVGSRVDGPQAGMGQGA